MEEGASGFLRKRILDGSTSATSKMEAEGNDGWESMDDLFESGGEIEKWSGFGTKSWASVYLAATPEQAALLGVPGADKVILVALPSYIFKLFAIIMSLEMK